MSQSELQNSTDSIRREPHKGIKYWAWAMGGPVGLILVGMWGRIQYFSARILLIPQTTIFIIYLIFNYVLMNSFINFFKFR